MIRYRTSAQTPQRQLRPTTAAVCCLHLALFVGYLAVTSSSSPLPPLSTQISTVTLRSSADASPNGTTTSRKVVRQIFRDEVSDEDHSNREEADGEQVRSKEHRHVAKDPKTSRPVEVFNGFPPDFTKGMKPFVFQDESRSAGHRDSKNTGFVNFASETDNIPSLASTLGGLHPFPPFSLSGTPGEGSATDRIPDRITPDTFVDKGQHQLFVGEDEEDLLPARVTRKRPLHDDDVGRFTGFHGGDFQEQSQHSNSKPSQGISLFGSDDSAESRSYERAPSTEDIDASFDRHIDIESISGSTESKEAFPKKNSSNAFEQNPQQRSLSAAHLSKSPKDKLDLLSSATAIESVHSPASKSVEQADTSGDPTDQALLLSKPSTYANPSKDFRDENNFDQSDSQNFIPHFHGGPVHFAVLGSFRPVDAVAHPRPQIRNFRQVSQQPQFFIAPGRFHGNGDGFFQLGGGHHGPTQVPSSQFESHPERFSQPEFYFRGEHRDRRPQRQGGHQQFHDDDNHHPSATNLLGSGNFGIIRGGIFADEDNPEPSFRPFHDHGGNEDFFHGFRDFQPFGGPMNNALSNNAQNIHRSSSKNAPVKTRPSLNRADSKNTKPSSLSSKSSEKFTDITTGQLMEEK